MPSKDARSIHDALSPDLSSSSQLEALGRGQGTATPTLRERAEEITRQNSPHLLENLATLSLPEIRQTLHELQVHQIELQMQNENLRQNQVELEAARARYFDFYDNAAVGYCTLSEQGLILEANLTAATLLGFDRAALTMQPISHYILKEYHDSYYLHRKDLFENGQAQSCELQMVKKDGSVFWASLKAIAVQDAENQPVCRVVITDITDRKLAEEALRNLSAYNRSLIEANLDSLVTIDPAGKISDVNSATEQVTGYLRQELIGTDFSDYFTEPEKARQGYQRAFKEGMVRDYPLEIRHHDGHITSVLYNATVYHDATGNVSGVFASARDITKRKKAEEALRETNALLSLFMKYTPIFTFIKEVTPTESRVLMASENFKDMIGIPGSAMVGMTMEQLFPAEFAAKITTYDWTVVSGGKMLTLDEQFNNHSYNTIKFPVSLGDRHLLAGYTIDITERKHAEEEKAKLEAVKRQLQKTESLGRMAGAVAHHFNNKLHVVMGNLEMAKECLSRGDTSMHNLTAAMQAANRAVEVSKMMLTYLGQVTGKQEPLDLSEICKKCLPRIQAGIPKNVDLKIDFQSPGPAVNANANQIQQILVNLLTNAWEAASNHRQCTIELAIKTVTPADIPTAHRYPINWQPDSNAYACLEIQDNGCGITEENLEEVFSPFFSTKFTGRGLGLPMVLGLVQAHRGVITVESSPERGSIFRVFLPNSGEEVPSQPDRQDNAPEVEFTGTVLLVDDDEIVLEITSMLLARLGFTVLSAKDGLEAMGVFRQHAQEICLVLSDMAMPHMNGWETLIALRQIAPDLPIILASGYSEDQVMEEDHPERPQAFLEKPFGFQALKDTIRRALAGTK